MRASSLISAGCSVKAIADAMGHSSPTTERQAFIVCWPIAIFAVYEGVRRERTGYWTDHPFSVNVFSGLTGFLFDAPIAIVVLGGIARRVNEYPGSAIRSQV